MNIDAAVRVLVDADVDFVLIGGWSAIIHGSSLITDDLEVCYSRKPGNLRRLTRALAPIEADLGKIVFLTEVAGLGTYEEISKVSVATMAFGRKVRTLDLESLIEAKRKAGRVRDLLILPELESLLEAQEP